MGIGSLSGKVDPSDLLILHEEVGTLASMDQGTTCATARIKLTSSSGKQSDVYLTSYSIVDITVTANLI